MRKGIRIICSLLATVCLCGMVAFAQEPGTPAVPASKEPKEVTDLTGTAAFLRNVKAFTTNFGGPYRFAEAEHKSPAQVYGDAPAEDAVALLYVYARAEDRGNVLINTSGHAFISVRNVSDHDLEVGGLIIAPGTEMNFGTRGNREEHTGVWYNLEGYYKYYLSDSYYQNLYGMQVSVDQAQLDVINQNLTKSDHWSAYYNCSAFAERMWNAVCSDTLSAGQPYSPANLQADMLAKYPDKLAFEPHVGYDYIVYYGKDLTPSEEFS